MEERRRDSEARWSAHCLRMVGPRRPEVLNTVRSISADEVPAFFAPGQKVYVAGSSNEPVGLLDAIARTPGCAADVEFTHFPLAQLNTRDLTALDERARVRTFFMAPQYANSPRVAFVPMQMRAVFDHIARTTFDIVLVQLAYDRRGRLRFGPNVDFVDAAIRNAHTVLAEVNRAVVAPAGCPLAPLGRITAVLETERHLAEFPAVALDDVSRRIGAHVAELIPDGACIQTGIGSIPAAALAALSEKSDLGLHSGLIDDAVMALIRRGVMTGREKPVDREQHVTGMALGSAKLLEWLADTPSVAFRGANHTHEVAVIRELTNFVSINSAVEVDLLGQVNAELVSGRQISGTGGSVDFMRAAKSSRGGRSIVALTATARGGTVSRIVPRAEVVTALRTDVDLVVTEYGVAELRDASNAERAERLIAIAAPQFREELTARTR
jgi:4-hydroxybutyrate CoA-transferase